jgi:hypothetical protein
MAITGTEITTAITSIKGAVDILKSLVGLRDGEAIRSKTAELYSVVLDSYEKAIAAREAQTAMIDRVRELEEEMNRLKEWDGEKDRYELKTPWTGATVYALKPDKRNDEPPHWLCAQCYQHGRKSLLQVSYAGRPYYHWKCPGCAAELIVAASVAPV